MTRQRKMFYGWWVVTGLVVVSIFGPAARFGMSAFFPFISADLGWSRSTIGFAQSIHMWAYAFFVLVAGWMIDRIGGQKTILIGGLLTIGGWLLLSIVKSPWQLYLYYGFVMAFAVSMTHGVPIQATARQWFVKRAGLVIGITTAAFSIGQAAIVPLLTVTSSLAGWRNISVICAFAFGIIIALSALLVIRDTPESVGLSPDGEGFTSPSKRGQSAVNEGLTLKESVKTSQLWLLFIAYAVQGLPFIGITAHIVMWGIDLGSSAAAAGIFATAVTLPAIATKIVGGWAGDVYGKRRMMVINNALCALAMLYAWQWVHTTQSLTVFSLVFGAIFGAQIGLYSPFLGDLFGRANIGFLFSLLTMGYGVIGGIGPLLWGKIFEISGSYNPACLVSAVCFAVAAVAVMRVRPVASKSELAPKLF